jgi:HK97 family phage major capsid protein
MAGIDINRTTGSISLPVEVSDAIISKVEHASAVQQLATNVGPLPGGGKAVDATGDLPEADWVAETDEKPVGKEAVSTKLVRGYTIAVIVPFSNQFRRDKNRLYNELVGRLPLALAAKFDSTILGGAAKPATLTDFDVFDLSTLTKVGVAGNVYSGILAANAAVAGVGGVLNGFAVAPQGRGLLIGSVDAAGRPILDGGLAATSVAGIPLAITKGAYAAGSPNNVGVAGDWTKAVWGSVEGVQVDLSDQATINDGQNAVNLWQRNMFAVRAEIEVGFRIIDETAFVALTDEVQDYPSLNVTTVAP